MVRAEVHCDVYQYEAVDITNGIKMALAGVCSLWVYFPSVISKRLGQSIYSFWYPITPLQEIWWVPGSDRIPSWKCWCDVSRVHIKTVPRPRIFRCQRLQGCYVTQICPGQELVGFNILSFFHHPTGASAVTVGVSSAVCSATWTISSMQCRLFQSVPWTTGLWTSVSTHSCAI